MKSPKYLPKARSSMDRSVVLIGALLADLQCCGFTYPALKRVAWKDTATK
jgi:hypothetical protein